MTVPFSHTTLFQQQQVPCTPAAAIRSATAGSSSKILFQHVTFTSAVAQHNNHESCMQTFDIPALDEPCDYYNPQQQDCAFWVQQAHQYSQANLPPSTNLQGSSAAAFDADLQLNLYNPEFEDAFAQELPVMQSPVYITKQQHMPARYCPATPPQSLVAVEEEVNKEEAHEQEYYDIANGSASPNSPPFTRPKKKMKRKIKKQRRQLLLQQQSSSSPMQVDNSEDDDAKKPSLYDEKPRKLAEQRPTQPPPVHVQGGKCKVFISHLVRSSDKEKTELIPITRGSLYLSTPHVHKLVVQVPVEDQLASTSTAPISSEKQQISLVLYRRVFRGESVNGKADKIIELDGGKKWRPVNFTMGLKGEPIKNAISVRKAYKPQLKIVDDVGTQAYEYQFDIQFQVNSFNTSRELEYANFVVQVRKNHCNSDESSEEEIIFNSEPFRLRARNDYVESKKRRLVMEGDDDEKKSQSMAEQD